MRLAIKILIFVIFISLIYLESVSLYIVNKFSHPEPFGFESYPISYGIEDFEKVYFESAKKDLTLNGYFMRKNSTKTIIICHGYGNNKFANRIYVDQPFYQLELAKFLLDNGYNVLIFDFRGHGEDAKKTRVTISYDEQQDLIGAINFVQSKGMKEIRIIGFSGGGATALSVLDKTNDVDFVIADSAFSDLNDYLKENMSLWTGFPDIPYTYLVLLNMKLLHGVKFSDASPVDSVSKTSIPILLIHGKKDKDIPYSESVEISKNFKHDKSRIVLFPDAEHCTSFVDDTDEYRSTIMQFLLDIE